MTDVGRVGRGRDPGRVEIEIGIVGERADQNALRGIADERIFRGERSAGRARAGVDVFFRLQVRIEYGDASGRT